VNVPGVEYHSPHPFTRKQRLSLAAYPAAGALFIRALGATYREEVRGAKHFEDALSKNGKVIIGFWHETIAMAIWHYRGRGYHTMTSYSYDGELAARAVRWFGLRAVRGSTSEGGGSALRELEKALAQIEGAGITPDGPRGPRRIAQAGAAILAARTGTPMIAHAVAARPAWRLRSWDRFLVPKPFARVIHATARPFRRRRTNRPRPSRPPGQRWKNH
jgi:lysophospholipid acyltransferase (LPLAT)-like uncharacterized protein